MGAPARVGFPLELEVKGFVMAGPNALDPGGTDEQQGAGWNPMRGKKSLTLVFERLTQEHHEIRASLGYKVRSYSKHHLRNWSQVGRGPGRA